MAPRILVIGCGGLGCELVKLLALAKENIITVIDNDTIDSTNLNRQFLFNQKDINKPKSEVVCNKIRRLWGGDDHIIVNDAKKIKVNDDNTIPMHLKPQVNFLYMKIDDINSIEFYRQFDVIYSCLDNDETRSYVNQRCYIARKKMIDGGSAGWLGQSFINSSECFDCLPPKLEKIYPICSIRQKPENFEHCVVWAKQVYEQNDFRTLLDEVEQHRTDRIDDKNNLATLNNSFKISNIADNNSEENISEESKYLENIDGSLYEYEDFFIENEIPNTTQPRLVVMEEIKDKIDFENISEAITSLKLKNLHNQATKQYPNCLLKTDKSFDSLDKISFLDFSPQIDKNSFIYQLASYKAERYDIPPDTFLQTTTFINRIVPSICTTNSIVASLMILSNKNNRNYYLSDKIISVQPNPKNINCLTCSLPNYVCLFGGDRLVKDFLKHFNADMVLTENMVYDRNSESGLIELKNQIATVIKNSTKNRVYFEFKGSVELEIKRYV